MAEKRKRLLGRVWAEVPEVVDGRCEERQHPPATLRRDPTYLIDVLLINVRLINVRSVEGVFGQFIRSMVSPLGQ